MNFKERVLNFFVRTYLFSKFRFHYSFDENFDPDRTDPYLLIGNHSSLVDGLYTSIPLNRYPFPVINSFMFRKPIMKFVLTQLIHSIPKRKGQSDISTIRTILETVKNEQRGVMLYPEGNASYFGKESPIPYSAAKLLKKLKLDLVVCKVNGGYLANPRWGDRPVSKGYFDVHYYTLFTAKELESIELDELYAKMVEALKFNDFEWNRVARHPYSLAHRAEGLERFIYACPSCGNAQSISTKKNRIYCKHCGKIAEFNEFSLLEGAPFDNLVEWDAYQKTLLPELVKRPLKTSGLMEDVDFSEKKIRSVKIGKFAIVLSEGKLTFSNDKNHFEFGLRDLKNLTLTRKEELSFDIGEKTYFVNFKDPMLFFDAINQLNGGIE